MDSKDREIIKALQRNGRLTNQDLAAQVNLSPSPCLRRTRALEEKGVIKGYTAIVDERAYGLPVTALVRIRLSSHTGDVVKLFEKKVHETEQILDCYVITGSEDYLLRVLVEDLKSYEEFVRHKLHNIPGIASIDSSFAYGVLKQSNVFPVVT
ncbi:MULTISPECIES: Lrp/AsnC family transcriptional regulator [Sulfitobacter]|jgi:Lrp/AsnC family leucine-responsive transcriptional regulator|uniref:Lrp/AsnC family transcriptional regulator n=1 Tax=Sulfitobacter sp. TCYB15 TaxID=3229275 RepID=A0AAU8C5K2_9RHOB|nr:MULTISPECIES: Lrp/AsnC family transcriptional regulator [Sulfitobacter]MAN08413.1 Lrp/AsnC family transcriptional regulator [Roseobacter sp.]KAJ32063.1 transcriptional regulator [Sulfitobacter pontiacus 3SOLIMAR09]MAX75682.1 Lrp/AsnC family transcriptional regulator [Roseobacter sp.]MAX77973.1 Lrp/AsnC family transcriptional regulator [Roseobacter sp.]MCP3879548.1 Lrp/AsnC family transcriptional regulator [Sulfitobacter sp.]|tara:strand:- start:131 stop:589 length:459 start_codon:yes stop_codon:yes gene_type:complete